MNERKGRERVDPTLNFALVSFDPMGEGYDSLMTAAITRKLNVTRLNPSVMRKKA